MAASAFRAYDPEYESVLRGDPCCYCGGVATHVDHIVPFASGGGGEWMNLTSAMQPDEERPSVVMVPAGARIA